MKMNVDKWYRKHKYCGMQYDELHPDSLYSHTSCCRPIRNLHIQIKSWGIRRSWGTGCILHPPYLQDRIADLLFTQEGGPEHMTSIIEVYEYGDFVSVYSMKYENRENQDGVHRIAFHNIPRQCVSYITCSYWRSKLYFTLFCNLTSPLLCWDRNEELKY